jgi:phosphopantothenoylcysteine decarboxylase
MKIILGLTGSVASILAPKLVSSFVEKGFEVDVIATEKALPFFDKNEFYRSEKKYYPKMYLDKNEWEWDHISPYGNTFKANEYQKHDPILHIELRKNASALVIAPASANTIGKIANGICDNLLTSLVYAWDTCRPMIVAPSMNSYMWENPLTQENLEKIEKVYGATIINPISKVLACGDVGEGALADVDYITDVTKDLLKWFFPLNNCNGIPTGKHPGAFGAIRSHDVHCGVDLYTNEGEWVYAVEKGRIVSIEDFTGPKANCPWWLPTKCVKVEGASGVVGYGEIEPLNRLETGKIVEKNERIGSVIPVLPPEKLRKDVTGHSCSMLHLQLYKYGSVHKDNVWELNGKQPDNVLDPTSFLLNSKKLREYKTLEIRK